MLPESMLGLTVCYLLLTCQALWCLLQAVPLPEPKPVETDPGPLPQPAKIASAYFEASSSLHSLTSPLEMLPLYAAMLYDVLFSWQKGQPF